MQKRILQRDISNNLYSFGWQTPLKNNTTQKQNMHRKCFCLVFFVCPTTLTAELKFFLFLLIHEIIIFFCLRLIGFFNIYIYYIKANTDLLH